MEAVYTPENVHVERIPAAVSETVPVTILGPVCTSATVSICFAGRNRQPDIPFRTATYGSALRLPPRAISAHRGSEGSGMDWRSWRKGYARRRNLALRSSLLLRLKPSLGIFPSLLRVVHESVPSGWRKLAFNACIDLDSAHEQVLSQWRVA